MTEDGKIVRIDYVNWRGERSVRRVLPLRFYFGPGNDWHEGPGWFMEALDCDRGETRDFALSGVKGWGVPEAPPQPEDPADWYRALAQNMADQERRAALYLPGGLKGPNGEGPRFPCVALEDDVPPGDRKKGERFEPRLVSATPPV